MIIGNYYFFTINSNNPIATLWKDRTWVSGYSEDNAANLEDCLNGSFDCNTLYEGAIDYTRIDNFDPKNFLFGEIMSYFQWMYILIVILKTEMVGKQFA